MPNDRLADRSAVTETIQALTAAWAAHDDQAYADQFTPDATYVTWVGTRYQGRGDIAASHRELWRKFLKGTTLADEITDIRFPTADTAIVTSRGEVQPAGRTRRLGKVQTYVLVRDPDGRWRIAAFQNTKHRTLAEAFSFRFAPGLRPTA
ncbi:SgcJ/EcaC family oxidoreductase [Actinoplanes oblitus]|uniref:SgcJ/EcaC family oxidoreductase n=1 Tax=Actinoplanes oblitus TaxID=3040509 RepID=A0ABY8WNR2_9ACTN|nr:SgcJ/EcaC family oxidoreductase [Actinoplanes oblitus]WIM99529.1 SgcJ/EcaC family oxidoreductase [Actinoplanes oblitus]